MDRLHFRAIPADPAITLYQALRAARQLSLQPALKRAVAEVGVAAIDADLHRLVPGAALNHVAALGLRGELVFPVPALIGHAPALLGVSRKEFGQPQRLGYGPWLAAEQSGRLSVRLISALDPFCAALIEPLSALVSAMGEFTDQDLHDLSLLTLGPTLQGGRNNVIGAQAVQALLEAVRRLLDPAQIVVDSAALLGIQTPAGRRFDIMVASDPDLAILEWQGEQRALRVAIEIKGGADASNAHNRAGEAEKSHLKARAAGYPERWTVIGMSGGSRGTFAQETPSSTALFEATEVLTQVGTDWLRFAQALLGALGLA